MVVRVTDANATPNSGVLVMFAASQGGGRVAPERDTTKSDGTAATAFTLGTAPGPNEVTAVVTGVPQIRSAIVTGVVGQARTISMTPRIARIAAAQDSLVVTATPRDTFANLTGSAVSWTSRNPALVTVTANAPGTAVVRAVGRPGQTYLVASSAGATDSLAVAVHDGSSTPCSFLAAPAALAVGGSLAFESTGLVCVTSATDAEYLLVGHYNTAVTPASVNVGVTALGIVPTTTPFPTPALQSRIAAAQQSAEGNLSFEFALRGREQRSVTSHIAGARAWFHARRASLSATTREGDLTSVNVNPFDFCSSPDLRSARVVAITDGAVILADTENPAGGFTDAEYRAMAVTVDTLITPIDTAAFGAPTDIDGNGRVTILFTRAVNALTPRGSSAGTVLGFFYVRDLLPRQSPFGVCPGSNVSEMFYVLVPDPHGLASDPRSKAFVQNLALSVIAHEYQHLINASRRIYVNHAPSIAEDVWLNEGLSHIAEELVFYRASKLGPRQNIGSLQISAGTQARMALEAYQMGNVGRYLQFLRAPDSNSPLASNDLVATRGASWAFLRYVADRAGAIDGDLWRRLVDSRSTGVVNLDAALSGAGMTTLGALRDWSVAVAADDNATGVSLTPALQQASWNFGSALPELGFQFPLIPPSLVDGLFSSMPLRSGGSVYLRFGVPANGEALLQVTGGGGAPPQPGVRLTVLRIR